MSQRLLIVDIIEAVNVIACEKAGYSDPLIVATLNDVASREIKNEKFTTATKKKTLDPKWSQRFSFGQNYDLNNVEALPTLVLNMYHKSSSLLGNNLPMGCVEIPLESINTSATGTDGWYPLQKVGRMKACSGEVHVSMRFSGPPNTSHSNTSNSLEAGIDIAGPLPNEEDDPDTIDEDPNELQIIVVQARNLIIMDKNLFGSGGSSDPLVKVKVPGQESKRTKIITKNLNPVWNDVFKFAPVLDSSLSVEFTVEDDDLVKNDFMGKVLIPLLPLEDKVKSRKWYKLKDANGNTDAINRGEIEIIMRWRFSGEESLKLKNKKTGIFSSVTGAISKIGGDSDDEEPEDEDGTEAENEKAPVSEEEAKKQAEEKKAAEDALKKELGDIEIKSGDYQIQVHIIEARELKGKDLNGLSDPIVYIDVFDQTQNSSVMPASLSCVFDELFIFNIRNLDKEVFESGVIKVRVMNANVVAKNDLIGSYAFDATYVYTQKNHESYRTWIALMNDENPEDTGVQGYLKLSVQIVGPGDKLKIHDEAEDVKEEQAKIAKSGGDFGALVVMPPIIKKEWKYLVTSVWRAEYLPVMDQNLIEAISKSGTDAFFQVSFANGDPVKTKVRTVKGNRSAMNPRFNYELWYPVSCPTMTQTIKCSMLDHDTINNELIGCHYSKFNIIQKMSGEKTGPFWANLYGAPESSGVSISNAASSLATKIKNVAGVDYKEMYNNHPDMAPCFKGRVLIQHRIETVRPKKYDTDDIKPFRRTCKKLTAKQEPPTKAYKFRALVVSGTEMPQFIDKLNPLKKQKLQIRISLGSEERVTQRVDCKNGVCEWNELLSSDEMLLPYDVTQIPDIFVHLSKGENKDLQPICYARFKAADIMKTNFQAAPDWINLKEDKSLDKIEDGEFPGTVLIKLGFGESVDAEATDAHWNTLKEKLKRRQPYQLRVHLYQGFDLPATDSNGLLDPYLKVNFLGETKTSKKLKKTRFPLYYETLIFDCQLPDKEFSPQVNIQLYDSDLLDSDDYCGMFFYNVRDAFVQEDLKAPLPDPQFHYFFVEAPGDGEGRLLASFQLIKKSGPTETLSDPPNLAPKLREAWIEIIALGLRDMQPYNFQAMQFPFLEIELETPEKKEIIQTDNSKKPEPQNPNFLQRLVMPVKLPDNALFATPLVLRAKDSRLGGYLKPEVAVGSVDLVNKIPWSKTYSKPQSDIFFVNDLNKFDPTSNLGQVELKKVEEIDTAAAKAIELQDARRFLKSEDLDNLVSTHEPIFNIDEYIKSRMLHDDTGAGVFGALSHLDMPIYGGKRRKKTAEDFFEEINFDEEEEDEGPPKYLKDREMLKDSLEDKLKTTPFETYLLWRGQKNGMFGSTLKPVGRFKGLIRVMESPDEKPLFDLSQLLKPQGYKIRLYVLDATKLTPMDMGFGGRPGKSDPYIKVQLGKQLFDDRENAIDDVTDVDLYKMIEMNAELPGTSQLIIDMMDKDDIGSDDLIGRTVIDLEDRWFDARWQESGKNNRVLPDVDPNNVRWDTKELEVRPLYVPSSNQSQGFLKCWLDILTPAESNAFPPDDVALPPRQKFEVRVVIWKTKDVPAQDTFGGQNMTDMYVEVWPEGCDKQTTDTHWRCKKGKGSFNWRMLFEVELGHNTRAMKFPYLHLQLWDKDLLKWNDCIAEGTIDLGKYYEKAFRRNCAIKLYETKKGAKADRAMEAARKKELYEYKDTEDDIPPDEPDMEEKNDDNIVTVEHDSDDEDGVPDSGIGVLLAKKKEEKKVETKIKKKAEEEIENQKKSYWPFSWFSSDDREEEEKQSLIDKKEKESEDQKKSQDADDQEMNDMIINIKNMTGLWDIDPPDSTWIKMDRLDHNTGIREPMGQLCFSVQIWPLEKAAVMPVGPARTEPNQDPFLPPPTGRLKFSWNPFVMGMELCGPSLCMKFMCCILCLGFLALLIFCQPVLNILIALCL